MTAREQRRAAVLAFLAASYGADARRWATSTPHPGMEPCYASQAHYYGALAARYGRRLLALREASLDVR